METDHDDAVAIPLDAAINGGHVTLEPTPCGGLTVLLEPPAAR